MFFSKPGVVKKRHLRMPCVRLQAAGAEPRSLERLLLVAAFSVSAYSGVKRTQKPFNAFLGETYELSCPEKGFRFLAEKVQ